MKRSAPLQRHKPLRAIPTEARASVPVFKPRKCRACKTSFTPTRQMQAVCGPLCAANHARAVAAKQAAVAAMAEKAADKAKREAMRSLSELTKAAQRAFNQRVRLEDIAAGYGCVSCGAPFTASAALTGGGFDCGHYLSTGARAHLRFDRRNAHLQCKRCNRFLAGNVLAARPEIVRRIGLAAVEALEADTTPRKWTRDELRAIESENRALVRKLKKEAA